MNKTVVVGMSGGVDSAVAAHLLKEAGHNVIALFMRNWDSTINGEDYENDDIICPQERDYNDAQKVCEKLGIPLHRIDFIKEYWDYVFTYFIEELKLGRTPNPDLLCNKFIKFDLFKKEAERLGADFVATGHYARLEEGKLLRAKDSNKDQTYFLAMVPKNQFENILFPIGDYEKKDIRDIALKQDLIVASKKDSTGICFIGERNYQKFIKNFLKEQPGDIINIETNEVIGTHKGLMNYTIGQRRNVGVSGNDTRHFVCGKNVEKNILYVTIGNEEYLYSDACLIDNINFISDERPEKCSAKFRYRGIDHDVILEYLDNNEILVRYPERAKSVTPGQACVLYLGEECLGCGLIKEVYKDNQKLWYL